MAIKKTKKLSEQITTTTVATGEKFVKVDANNNVTLIDLSNLKSALLSGLNLDSMMDGVFIMYHRISDGFPLIVKPHKWTALQNAGEIADGVMVVEGGKILVVAPTEADGTGLFWSSANVSGDATNITDQVSAMADWNGKANTASIISKSTSEAVTNTAAYAPGFCNLYSRANANGKGLLAGKWWLPSMGEMLMIFANMTKINYCLSLISGATPLLESAYWTSTDRNTSNAWIIYLSHGYSFWRAKISEKCRVRPVSTFYS